MKNRVYFCIDKGVFKEITTDISDTLLSDYVLVKYIFCGICGGDYSTYIGRRKQYPTSLGHEFVAEILRTGENVKHLWPGQLVVSDFNYRCGECFFCKHGKSHLCVQNNIEKFSNRAFAEYGIIHHKYLYRIDKPFKIERACFIEPLSCVLHALDEFQPPLNEPLLVNGAGSIGSMVIFYLNKVLHHENIYVYDINQSRLNNLSNCFNVKLYDRHQALPMHIIECTNDVGGIRSILQKASQGAYICIMSHLYGEDTSFIYEELCRKELHSCYPLRNGHIRNIHRAIAYVRKYWSPQMDLLYSVSSDIYNIFKTKKETSSNKQIFDVQNSFKSEVF